MGGRAPSRLKTVGTMVPVGCYVVVRLPAQIPTLTATGSRRRVSTRFRALVNLLWL